MQFLGLFGSLGISTTVSTAATYVAEPWYQILRDVLLGLLALSFVLFIGVHIWRLRTRKKLRQAAEHPFKTLALQNRLSELAAEVQRLERGEVWARGHHLRAAEAAYDHLLAEACARAGVANELAEAARLRAAKPARLDMELALSERGWNW